MDDWKEYLPEVLLIELSAVVQLAAVDGTPIDSVLMDKSGPSQSGRCTNPTSQRALVLCAGAQWRADTAYVCLKRWFLRISAGLSTALRGRDWLRLAGKSSCCSFEVGE